MYLYIVAIFIHTYVFTHRENFKQVYAAVLFGDDEK